ncbi:hypothetical protein [Cohnella soli]|uniref:Lipocalin-like domain-containing protein n=1 Tax=Cohnella soli TaxID=425005 RepID=A0ABW0HPG6_9BACL
MNTSTLCEIPERRGSQMRFVKLFYISTILLTLITSGCSSTKDSFIGSWSALQLSQAEGTNEELIHYNYWEVKDNEISFSNFVLTTENGVESKRFDENNKMKYEYKWETKNQIVINQKIYSIEIKNKKLKVSNSNMEIDFERAD